MITYLLGHVMFDTIIAYIPFIRPCQEWWWKYQYERKYGKIEKKTSAEPTEPLPLFDDLGDDYS
tara:strand:- start:369 stop:560 length:192 start_codon:yes stop_codon:yes gene_type:complete